MGKIKDNIYMISYIWKINKLYIIMKLLLSMIMSLSPFLMNLMLKNSADIIFGKNNFVYISLICIYIIYSLLSSLLSNYLNNIYFRVSEENINREILNSLYEKSRKINILKYDNYEFFNMYNFIMSNSITKTYDALNSLNNFILNFFSILTLVALLMTIDKIFIIFAIINSIIGFMINMKLSTLNYTMHKESNPHHRIMNYIKRIHYLKDYSKDLRASSISNPLLELYDNGKQSLINIIKTKGKIISMYSNLEYIIRLIFIVSSIIYLSFKLQNGLISVGEFIVAFNIFAQISGMLAELLGFIPKLHNNSLYINDFRKFMDYEIEDDSDASLSLNNIYSLELHNVSFKYDDNKFVLNNINIKIEKGKSIALVGENGSGKSTLANIIQGFYKPTTGDVYINNFSINNYKKTDLYSKIGGLYQDYKIYGLTILENIIMDSKKNYNDDKKNFLTNIIKEMNLYNSICNLPKGIDTNIGFELNSNATNFSGGQLQKIGLARAIYHNYDIIVLDEPSSSLDSFSEKQIFEQIKKIYSNKGIIFISHRLSNIVDVDRIYYIENGKIVEEGSHEELIKLNGKYSKLFEMQIKNYI